MPLICFLSYMLSVYVSNSMTGLTMSPQSYPKSRLNLTAAFDVGYSIWITTNHAQYCENHIFFHSYARLLRSCCMTCFLN